MRFGPAAAGPELDRSCGIRSASVFESASVNVSGPAERDVYSFPPDRFARSPASPRFETYSQSSANFCRITDDGVLAVGLRVIGGSCSFPFTFLVRTERLGHAKFSMKPSNPTLFRALGYLSIALAIVLLILFLANLRSRLLYNGPDYSPLLWMSIYCGAVGIGLVYLKKWAVALFAVSTLAIGIFIIVRSTIETAFPWTLINIAMGVLFCLPTMPAIRCWGQFK